jgi:dCTP deaminase
VSFWSGQTLKARIKTEKLVEPFDDKHIECSAYALHVGYEAFVSRDRADQAEEIIQGRTPGHLRASAEETFSIPSGQFAFLITKEKVRIPNDAIGFISLKTRKKFGGLVNVSGFHVDPGWSGKLIFAVFNAGARQIVIQPDEPLFLLFFADLDSAAEKDFLYEGKSKFDKIPTELMETMSAPVPTVYKLNEAVRDLRDTAKGADTRSLIALTLGATALAAALAVMGVVSRLI